MRRRGSSSVEDKAERTVPWGAELNVERRTCTFRPQTEEDSCKLVLGAICLGEKAKEEVNRVEIAPSATPGDKRPPTITIATLKLSVLPMVAMAGISLSPPVTFQLRAGSGPVFLSGQECYYGPSDPSWQEEEEEVGEEEEEEDDEDDEEEEEEADVSTEDTPAKQVKRLVPQKQASAAKKKKVEKEEEEAARRSVSYKTPSKKSKSSDRSKKLEAKKKSTSDTP